MKRYLGKISEPLLDRIDICAEVLPVSIERLQKGAKGEKSSDIKKRVEEARQRQKERYGENSLVFNSHLTSRQVKTYCILGKKEQVMMEEIFKKYNMSTRAYQRILKVARTIADLAGEEQISTTHLSEAFFYRSLDKKYWR